MKLDTNGYRPEVVEDLFRQGLLDYIAMDIKSSPEHYAAVAGFPGLQMDGSGKVPPSFRAAVFPMNFVPRWCGSFIGRRIFSPSDAGCRAQRPIFCSPTRKVKA